MYVAFKCKKCGKEFILLTEQYIQNIREDKYISCAYCGSDNVNIEWTALDKMEKYLLQKK